MKRVFAGGGAIPLEDGAWQGTERGFAPIEVVLVPGSGAEPQFVCSGHRPLYPFGTGVATDEIRPYGPRVS